MRYFFKKPNEKIFGLKDLDPERLMYRVMPYLMMEVMRKYFRLEVEGLANIPRRGSALITPNHSGYLGLDAFLLSHQIFKATGRTPRVLAHHLWFLNRATSVPANKVGFVEASTANALKYLGKRNLVMLFPEGEFGNFKPTVKRYHLQPFKRGFVRLALQTQTPIIPTLVLGAEETHINLTQLKFTKYLRGLVLPLPLNVVPLPAKWKIRFLPPIKFPYQPSAADDAELVHELAQNVREEMQQALSEEVAKRGNVFF